MRRAASIGFVGGRPVAVHRMWRAVRTGGRERWLVDHNDNAPSPTSQNAQFARFGSCMRSHGEPQFQNPIVSGNTVAYQVTPSLGIGTPRYAQATATCRRYLPPGIQPPGTEQITQADELDYLKAVACLRTHGFPSVPDPTFTGGSVHINVPKIYKSSPSFQRAVATCRKLIPAGLPYSG